MATSSATRSDRVHDGAPSLPKDDPDHRFPHPSADAVGASHTPTGRVTVSVDTPLSNRTSDSPDDPTADTDDVGRSKLPAEKVPRNRLTGSAFALAVAVADALTVTLVAVLIDRWRIGVAIAPNGNPGDVLGLVLTVGAVLLTNWALGLYRCPPSEIAVAWVGRAGLALIAAVGVVAFGSLVVNRPLLPRLSTALVFLIVPGVWVGIRQVASLLLSPSARRSFRADDESPADDPIQTGPWLADVGWAVEERTAALHHQAPVDDNVAEESFTIKVRPSVRVLHRLDQVAVVSVALWAAPLAGIIALWQRFRNRPLLHHRAPNNALVPTFDFGTNSIAHRTGIDRLPGLWSAWCGRVSLIDPTLPGPTLAITRSVRRWPFVLSWLLAFRVFGLGHTTGDTWGHILSATRVWPWESWHPLLNAMIFVPSYELFGSPLLVTGTLIGLFWLGLWLVTRSIERASGRNFTTLAVVIGFNPMLFNYMGLLAKDAFAAATIVLCVSLLVRERVSPSRRGLTLTFAGVAAWAAAMFNPATITITLVLIVYVWARALANTSLNRATRVVLACVLGAGAALGTVVVEGAWEAQLQVTDAHKEEAIMLFDLAGMSDDLGVNLLPNGFLPSDRVDEFVSSCYDPKEWDSLTPFGGRCTWVLGSDEANRIWNAGDLAPTWETAIREHPGSYVRHRFRHIGAFLTSPGKMPTYYWWEVFDFEGNWQLERNAVQDQYSSFYNRAANSVLFRPITWLFGTMVLLVIFAIRLKRHAPSSWGALPFIICSAVISFYVGWTLIGVAYDFRYNYSVIWLFFLALLLLISDVVMNRAQRPSAASATVEEV